ncbi:cAMP-regulated D2 protein precursor [Heterostelium album PN500]|uniref:Carboxylic ester hydrolase n=1 Tax=Heterostelium pallidum (strain ATCC 26659 / Pp 5 / PN500) TaxID=670386 RepID=D3BQG0_HETP5|nr:cAMP-regulated D2 protein precursor [Heterostelium album PN500]EFA76380.1 cAMP-regulated D2 protein precursor [Heterostelium album PN500]|eukprot:XP_020428512.1 cAMP-regulated D2 protein precursor [Heterostelium album PN500]
MSYNIKRNQFYVEFRFCYCIYAYIMKVYLYLLTVLSLLISLSFATEQGAPTKTKPHPVHGNDPSLVTYADGTVRGLVFDKHRTFYGLPYAKPPVGDLRWQNPLPPNVWEDIRNATYERDGCPQECNLASFACPVQGTNEDCLFLNVFTPISNTTSLKPVYVFIPGGAFTDGSADVPLYDGKHFAEAGIVLVTINYRLGILGFLGNEDINLSGNYGFLDQIAALHWVRNHISAFGGDPDQVSLGGQSAGAMSVVGHLISPLSNDLFQSVIVESSPTSLGFKTIQEAKDNYAIFSRKVKCTTFQCLKDLSAAEITKIQNEMRQTLNLTNPIGTITQWTPVIDGPVIPSQPLDAFEQGNFNHVPVILGENVDEGDVFVYPFFKLKLAKIIYNQIVNTIFRKYSSEIKNQVLDLYPGVSLPGDNRPILARLLNDLLFKCPNRYMARALSKNGDMTYLYRYTHVNSFNGSLPFCHTSACHGDELPYVFNSYDLIGFNVSVEEREMAANISNYWYNFIENGDPNLGAETPVGWPRYIQNDKALNAIKLRVKIRMTNLDNISEGCDLFDELDKATENLHFYYFGKKIDFHFNVPCFE